jgi:hypothetical protein
MSARATTGFSYRDSRHALISAVPGFDKTFLHRIAIVSARAIRAD